MRGILTGSDDGKQGLFQPLPLVPRVLAAAGCHSPGDPGRGEAFMLITYYSKHV